MNGLLVFIGVVVSSCYLFPFEINALPGINSKMVLALAGAVIFMLRYSAQGLGQIGRDYISITLWTVYIGLASLLATVVNNTHDYSFLTFGVSMWVWIGGAYGMCAIIKGIHGELSVELVARYLIAVCVLQCLLALIFKYSTPANDWFNNIFGGSEAYMGKTGGSRLHGIGCALDVAGLRFAGVICIAAFLVYNYSKKQMILRTWLVFCSIAFIFVIGDMISRTTFLGLLIGVAFWIFVSVKDRNSTFYKKAGFVALICFTLCFVIYKFDGAFAESLRFGFEGFFSLFETGEWSVSSNDILENMVVFPDNLKTWIFGDGYSANPADINSRYYDPYYIGKIFHGFYMATDIGYCRFLFYFGLIGTVFFIGFFINVCYILCKRFPEYVWMFILILAMNLTGWCKVTTDLFILFAPFLCITRSEEEESNENRLLYTGS